MPWYDDRTRTEFVGNYSNAKQLQWDEEKAVRRGWTRASTANDAAEPRVQAAIDQSQANSVAERMTVTFTRSADWLAERERTVAAELVTAATRTADEREARLLRAVDGLKAAESEFALRCDAAFASTEPRSREKAERELVTATTQLTAKRRTVLKCFDEALEEMVRAVAVGASEFSSVLPRYQRERAENAERLAQELVLLRAQNAVAQSMKEWRVAIERQEAAAAELRKHRAGFENADAKLRDREISRQAALQQLAPTGLPASRPAG